MRSIPGGVVVSAFSVHSVLFRFIFFSFVVFFFGYFLQIFVFVVFKCGFGFYLCSKGDFIAVEF